jgi:hypothetical protein
MSANAPSSLFAPNKLLGVACLLWLLGGFQITAQAQPANDNFASSTLVANAAGSIAGSNVNATKEAGEPNHAGNAGGRSIWYRWTAPSNGTVTFNTAGSSFDTLMGVYLGGAVNSLVTIASNDDGPRPATAPAR